MLLSGEAARVHTALIVATGAAAIGRCVVLFATSQGCHALEAAIDRFSAFDTLAATRGVAGISDLRDAARELGVRMIACETGLRLADITADLAEGVEVAGIVTFLEAVGGGQVITL